MEPKTSSCYSNIDKCCSMYTSETIVGLLSDIGYIDNYHKMKFALSYCTKMAIDLCRCVINDRNFTNADCRIGRFTIQTNKLNQTCYQNNNGKKPLLPVSVLAITTETGCASYSIFRVMLSINCITDDNLLMCSKKFDKDIKPLDGFPFLLPEN